MGNATWLFFALPTWYLETVFNPFSYGPITTIPAVGVLCLFIGVVLGILRRNPSLLWFLTSIVLSQAFVALSGFLRGQLNNSVFWPILAFALLQLLAIVLSLRASASTLVPAGFIAIFCISYALYAWFVSAMSLSNTWL